MFNVNKVEVKVSDETIQKFTDYLKTLWFGSPSWLRVLVCVTLFVGATYFFYNRLETAGQVDSLREELRELNEKCEQTVFLDSYAFDVNNFVVVARTIEKELTTVYEINGEILDMFEDHVKRATKDGNDPTIQTIHRIRSQNEFSKQSFDNIVQHNLKIYEDWLKKVQSNDERSIDGANSGQMPAKKRKKKDDE